MHQLQELLQHGQHSGQIVSIYTNRKSPNKCSLGYVESVTDKIVILNGISKTGANDGRIIRHLSRIFKVEIGGIYAQKIAFFHKLPLSINDPSPQNQIQQRSVLDELLKAKVEKLVVSIWLSTVESDSSYFTGYVASACHAYVIIKNLDDFG